MRFGKWRGVAAAFALTMAVATGLAGSARADLFHYSIPREVEAVDIHTGGPYMAPPIPYGHYAKDSYLGHVVGTVHGCCGAVKGKLCGLLHPCGGKDCGHGCSDGSCGGDPGSSGGSGLFGGNGCGNPGCSTSMGCGFCRGKGLLSGFGGHCGKGGGECAAPAYQVASVQAPSPQAPSAQCVTVSAQCGQKGCLLLKRHFHRRGMGCSACNGGGCGICRDPGLSSGSLCGSCNGAGCGTCGGLGLFGKHGGKDSCGHCGGKGCMHCLGAIHSVLGLPHALINKITHKGEIEYFVGPGGPVPITPGYVPYVVTTRSPRDFLAFPPFVENVP